jgi:arabinogalactan oligomer/maltooligosaccharide transport system permease protein
MRGVKIYRSFLIIPYAAPALLTILVWSGMLNQNNGIINSVLDASIPWTGNAFWAKVSILIVNLWLGFPYMFLIGTGALQAIPQELSEAAEVDGASPWQILRRIKLPLLLIATGPLLVASFAYNFNNFNIIYLLTGGGPAMKDVASVAGETDILISYTYKLAFSSGTGSQFGLSSAVSIIIFFIVAGMSGPTFWRSKAMETMN